MGGGSRSCASETERGRGIKEVGMGKRDRAVRRQTYGREQRSEW